MNNVMLDLETMGNGQRAAIVGIGAVLFDPLTGELGAEFECTVSLLNSAKYGEIDPSTVLWWMNQSPEARAKLSDPHAVLLSDALFSFSSFLIEQVIAKGPKPLVWGNGATFDNVIITSAYLAINSERPWPFWNDRDVRTIVDLGRTLHGFDPKKETPFVGIAHTPLADAKHQARYVSAIYQKLAGGKA